MITADVSCRLLECVSPESRILKSDLTWVRADAVQLGDELLAFDALINGVKGTGKGRGHAHKFQAGRVTNLAWLSKPRVRVTTTHGATVVAANHPFVARHYKHARRWITAANLKPGMLMAFLAEPWEVDQSRDAGYLAGIFDGEGWIGRVNVGFAQNVGPTLWRVQQLLAERQFEFRNSPSGSSAHVEITNGIRPTLRFLGSIRPPRLMPKARQIWEGRRTWGKQSPVCKVISVEPLEDGPVVAIETTTKTYISDGFFSHNCDFGGIEALLTGRCLWTHGFSSEGAKQYIRLARLGMHAAVTALKVGKPIDLTAPDDLVKIQLNAVKRGYPIEYDTSKRTVHANNFGMTTYGMVEKFPEFFPTLKAAEEFQSFYYALAPDLPNWHRALRQQAKDSGFLGGPTAEGKIAGRWDHPYGYRHWFWDVFSYQPINEFTARKWMKDPARSWRVVFMHGRWYKAQPSGDFNRVIAFFPQSIAAGRLKEAENRLFLPWSDDYIGDCYFGRTPLLAPIHDSLLLIIPVRCWDRVVETVARVMQEPSSFLPIPREWGWGANLPIGISAKAGTNWAPQITEDAAIKLKLKYDVDVRVNLHGMEEIEVPKFDYVMHAGPDDPVLPRESEGDEEEWNQLKRAVA